MQLLGEYVVEICVDIERFLNQRLPDSPEISAGLRDFVTSNPAFMALTRARAVSYWTEYYRGRFPCRDAYPPLDALDILNEHAASEG